MAIFKTSEERLAENYVYELVAKELQDGVRKDGLWLKAATEADDDEKKARRLYVRYRVQEIKDELNLKAKMDETPPVVDSSQREDNSNLEEQADSGSGDFGLLLMWLGVSIVIFIIVVQVSMSPLFN